VSHRRPIIYIVDDDASVCRALSLLLKSHGLKVRIFTRAADFLACFHPKVPSALVLDIRLPDINGLVLQEAIAARKLTIPIVFITGHGDIPMSVRAMRAGAIDFLPKPLIKKKLFSAVAQAIVKSKIQLRKQAKISRIKRLIGTLTPREREVFRLVAKGMLSKQIALKRGTALQTIKVHRSRVMQKLQAKTVTELIRFAQKAGIVSPQR